MPLVCEHFGMYESPTQTMGTQSQVRRPTVLVYLNKFKAFFVRQSVFVHEPVFCTSSSPVCQHPLTHFIHHFPLVRYRLGYKTRPVIVFRFLWWLLVVTQCRILNFLRLSGQYTVSIFRLIVGLRSRKLSRTPVSLYLSFF